MVHRPSYYNYANRQANVQMADNKMRDTPLGQTWDSFTTKLQPFFALLNEFLGIKKEGGGVYGRQDFFSTFMTAFGYHPYESAQGSKSSNRPAWDRPTWEKEEAGQQSGQEAP